MTPSALHRNQPEEESRKTAQSNDAVMFDLAPVSLWLEDFSGVKELFDEWRRGGVTDLRGFLLADASRVKACSDRIKVVKVNRRTLFSSRRTTCRIS